jgi:hypothetical protein
MFEDECGFEESIAALNIDESKKTENAFSDIVSTLYNGMELDTSNNNNPEQSFRGGYFGYDAHSADVKNSELELWRKNFKYINVVGVNVLPQDNSNNNLTSFNPIYDDTSRYNSMNIFNASHSDNTLLAVVGTAAKLHPQPYILASDNQEIFEQNGILEEIIAIDISNDEEIGLSTDSAYCDSSLEPSQVHHMEVMNSLFDVIWSNVVEKLHPLVEQVVEIGTTHNITIDLNESNTDQPYNECADQDNMSIGSW